MSITNWFVKKLAAFAAAALLFFIVFNAPGSGQSSNSSIDFEAGKLADAYIRRKMAAEQIPGAQVAVMRNGRLIKAASYGVSNVELNTSVTNETMFEIASNSKQFTAGGILLLSQDGKLNLNDSITKYIKGLPGEYRDITIRHLLTHTSGVKDYIEEFELNRRLDYTNQQLIAHIAANPLNFPPGEGSRYSTTGYLLLGIIIENVTGKAYGEFLRERIFEPLGMRHTRVISLTDVIPGRATGYVLRDGKLSHGQYVAQTLRSSADIGLMTNASDMAKWAAALDSTKIFSRASLDQMVAPGKIKNGDFAYNDWNGYFGSGWFIDDYLGNREIDHGGTLITGFHCNISRFVDKKLTVIVLTNRLRSNPSMLGYTIAGMYDRGLRPPHMLGPKQDVDPARTARVRDFLKKAASGSVDQSRITAGFLPRFVSDQGPVADIKEAFAGDKPLLFVDCKDMSDVERIGSKIETICTYKVTDKPRNHYITVYLASNERLADLWIYSYGD